MSSKAQRDRRKRVREHKLNPEVSRQHWNRKPLTQVVKNKKAEQRRLKCRREGHDDGAVYYFCALFRSHKKRARLATGTICIPI